MNILSSLLQRFKTDLRLISLAALYIFFSFLLGQDYSAGLRFYNKHDFIENGEFSSLDISNNDPITISDEFTLSFDFSMRNPMPFGFFFKMKADSLTTSVLSNVDFKDPDTTYFEFSFWGLDKMISIPILKTELNSLNWHHISITYNFLLDEVRMVLNDTNVRVMKFPMLNEQNIHIQFGFTPFMTDVPSMSIKNIKFADKTRLLHHWRLNEYSGDYAYDHIGGRRAKTKNTQWEYESHTIWQMADSILLDNEEQIVKSANSCYLILVSDKMKMYDLESHGFISNYNHVKMQKKDRYYHFMNTQQKKIYGFDHVGTQYYSFDLTNNKEVVFPITGEADHYYSPGTYYDEVKHELFSIGGYGRYRTKNHFRKFDFIHSTWDTLAIWGDTFHPRYGTTVSNGPDPNCLYIFGGVGNDSGMQERGWRILKGFWKFNRKTLELKKEFSFDGIENYHTAYLGSSKEIDRFLLAVKPSKHTLILVYSIDPDTYAIEYQSAIPNTANVNISLGGNTPPFIGPRNGKLTVATQKGSSSSRSSLIRIHTLNYPPMEPPPVSWLTKWGGYGIGILALVVSLGIIGFRWKKNGAEQDALLPFIQIPSFSDDENPYSNHDFAVQCFGNFKLFKQGTEIMPTEWVSKKARLLFIYLIVKGDYGVTPNDISMEFWPNSNYKSAANSRYVAMSQIRKVLGTAFSDIINNFDHNIYIKLGADHFSDIHYFSSVVKAKSQTDILARETALRLYGRGKLCHDVQENWMEEIRQDSHANAKRIASSLINSYRGLNRWQELADLGKQVLSWDSLDEDGIQWAMEGLIKNHHMVKAKSVYDIYTKNYEQILDDRLDTNFKQMQSKYM